MKYIVVVLAGLAGPLGAQEFVSDRLFSFEAGVICAQDTGITREAPGTIAGTTHVVDEAPDFVSNGRKVPAVLGIGFGAKASVMDDVGMADVVMRVTHPPFRGHDTLSQTYTSFIGPKGDPGITFYQFDYSYELAMGLWTFEAIQMGEVIYRTEFTVVPPETLPELAGVCGYVDLLS